MTRDFGSKEALQRAVSLIAVYNPRLDAQLKREGRMRRMDERLLVNLFPAQVVMPTIIEQMGVMAANRANRNNIHPVVLLKQEDKTKGLTTEEITVSPTWVFNESIRDAIKVINMSNTFLIEHYRRVYDRLWEGMEYLYVEERERAEVALFALTQSGLPFLKGDSLMIRSELHGSLDPRITYNPSGNRPLRYAFRKPMEEWVMEEWVEEVISDFENIFSQARHWPPTRFFL